MPCEACKKQIKTWSGDDPKCGFESGQFDPDNWMCATTKMIRRLADRSEGDAIPGIHFHVSDNEQRYSVIDLDKVKEFFDAPGPTPVSLYVGWYKNRGRTECMWLMFESEPPRPPTEQECLWIMDAYGPVKIKQSGLFGSHSGIG